MPKSETLVLLWLVRITACKKIYVHLGPWYKSNAFWSFRWNPKLILISNRVWRGIISYENPNHEPRFFRLWLDRGSSFRCFLLDLNLGFTLRISLDYANAGDFTWLKLEKSKKKREKTSYNQVKIKRKASSNRDNIRFFVLPVAAVKALTSGTHFMISSSIYKMTILV